MHLNHHRNPPAPKSREKTVNTCFRWNKQLSNKHCKTLVEFHRKRTFIWRYLEIYSTTRPSTTMQILHYKYLCIWTSDTREHFFKCTLCTITHVGHICNFDQSSICVFVFLCICICVFAYQTPWNIILEVLVQLPFSKI